MKARARFFETEVVRRFKVLRDLLEVILVEFTLVCVVGCPLSFVCRGRANDLSVGGYMTSGTVNPASV
jgi:hypothetical protein